MTEGSPTPSPSPNAHSQRMWRNGRLLVYPLTLIAMTPYRLAQAAWRSRILAQGRWSRFNMFCARKGLNHLFYWTQACNLDRYGRSGISPNVGLGDFKLARWFHLSLLSSHLGWRLGAVLPLVAMTIWLLMHLPWFANVEPGWMFAILATALVSTQFYAATFGHLNYNALGWALFPLGLWGWLTGNYAIAAVAWLGASFGSMTVVVIAALLSVFAALQHGNVFAPASVLPALLKLATHLVPLVPHRGEGARTLRDVASTIGATRHEARYARQRHPRDLLSAGYFVTLYAVFGAVYWLSCDHFPVLWLGGIAVYLLNAFVVRFCDSQHMHMMQFGLATALLLENPTPWLLAAYWLVASPLPRLLAPFLFNDRDPEPAADLPPAVRPFDVGAILERVDAFLLPVARGQRVLAAFDDPGGLHRNVFDGYRVLHEAPLYVAATRGLHLMPDWHAVVDSNRPGGADFWGRSPDEVERNVESWAADFVLVRQESGTSLDPAWGERGYVPLTELDWADLAEELNGERPWRGPTPKWWLLERPRASRPV